MVNVNRRTVATQYRRLKATQLSEHTFTRLVLDEVAPDPRGRPNFNPEARTAELVLRRAERKRDEIRRLWDEGTGHAGDHSAIRAELGVLHDERGLSAVIHGAARGADRFAGEWARDSDVPEIACPADWVNLGRRAGMVRNARMLALEKPDAVLAFHDDIGASRGTKSMVDRAIKAGLSVTIWTHGCDLKVAHVSVSQEGGNDLMKPAVPPAVPYSDAREGNDPPVRTGTRSSEDNGPTGNGRRTREVKPKLLASKRRGARDEWQGQRK